jgi:hypothetical protein
MILHLGPLGNMKHSFFGLKNECFEPGCTKALSVRKLYFTKMFTARKVVEDWDGSWKKSGTNFMCLQRHGPHWRGKRGKCGRRCVPAWASSARARRSRPFWPRRRRMPAPGRLLGPPARGALFPARARARPTGAPGCCSASSKIPRLKPQRTWPLMPSSTAVTRFGNRRVWRSAAEAPKSSASFSSLQRLRRGRSPGGWERFVLPCCPRMRVCTPRAQNTLLHVARRMPPALGKTFTLFSPRARNSALCLLTRCAAAAGVRRAAAGSGYSRTPRHVDRPPI